MSTTPIRAPLPGEQVIAHSPQDAGAAAATWLRRPNLFPGRTLTAPTLDARQLWAAGRLAQRGQAYTAGVVQGLEVGYASEPAVDEGDLPRVRLQIGAGRGLAVSGEDVVLARALDADLFGLPVVAPPELLVPGGGVDGPDGDPPEAGSLRARRIGDSLGRILADPPEALPMIGIIGILVLQPVTVDRSAIDPDDPCDRCGCGTAGGNVNFEDWRLADAVRLLWYVWPEEWRALPADTPRLRNALAYTVFEAEAALAPGEILPWEEFGVPIALIALAGDFQPRFADAAAVVRQGGSARIGRLQFAGSDAGALSLMPNERLPALWQAQMVQLAEQIAELGDPSPDAATLAEGFGRLPPCGLLPTNAYDPETRSSAFFPAAFELDAVPVPLDQMDLAVRESAGLAPLDFALGERVRVLVPVSQASWEPRLLYRESLDPEFTTTLDRFLLERARALGLRQGLRTTIARLTRSVTGQLPEVPAIEADPAALETESLAPWGPPPQTGGHRSMLRAGLHQHFFDSATATLTLAQGDSLYVWVYLDPDAPPRELMLQWFSGTWEHRAYWGENLIALGADLTASRLFMGPLPTPGQWLRVLVPPAAIGLEGQVMTGMAFTLFDGRAAFGASGRLTEGGSLESPWFDRALPAGARSDGDEPWEFLAADSLWGPFEPDFGLIYGAQSTEVADLTALQASPSLAVLSDAERRELRNRGLESFIDYLASRADRADDLIDYGFVKVQTDIYRVRQLVLGTSAAAKLVVSPTLAGVAQSETAVESQEKITAYFEKLRVATPRARAASPIGDTLPPVSQGSITPASASATPRSFRSEAALSRSEALAPIFDTGGIRQPALSGPGAILATDGIRDASLTGASVVAAQLSTDISPLRLAATVYRPTDIANARPLIGRIDLRTATLGERLTPLPATEARDYSTSTRHEAVLSLIRLADELTAEDGGVVPGLFQGIQLYGLAQDRFLETDEQRAARRRPFADFLVAASRTQLLSSLLDVPDANGDDETSLLSDSAGLSDRTVALLRQIEGRARLYRDVVATCEETLERIRGHLDAARSRERQVGEQLAEARHDVAVTRALIAEEQQRLDGINQRRAAVLADEVQFLAFIRLRTTDTLAAAPTRTLDPGFFEAPIPACLGADFDIPEDLAGLLRVVRDAPAAWFNHGPPLIASLDHIDLLVKTLQTTQLRSQLTLLRTPDVRPTSPSGAAAAIAQLSAKQSQSVNLIRAAAMQIDVARFANLSWLGAQTQAAQVVSLGDLIDGEHGRGDVARSAAEFFDRFSRVGACLYAELSSVLPALRLDWAEQLSQFDAAPNLRNLASLPRWQEIETLDRRRMQSYVDWLFGQIDTREAAAVSLVNDVVRMTLLVASHAPVNRIIAGRLPRPVIARPGFNIPLVAIEPSRLRVGMQALVYRANEIVARAVVEDIGTAEASARVITAAGNAVELDETVRVQFASAASVSFASAPMRLF